MKRCGCGRNLQVEDDFCCGRCYRTRLLFLRSTKEYREYMRTHTAYLEGLVETAREYMGYAYGKDT